MLKKIIVLLVCIPVIAGIFYRIPSLAYCGPVAELSVNEVNPGEKVILTVGYECETDITGTVIEVGYDTGLLFDKSSSEKEYVCDTIDTSGGAVRLIQSEGYEDGTGWAREGTVAKLAFVVDPYAKAGKTLKFSITLDSFSDGEFNQYPSHKHAYEPVTKEVSVTVRGVVKGDVTGDGQVTSEDLTALARHIAKIELLPEEMLKSADVDGSGDVNSEDLTVLARYIAKIIDQL